MVKICLRFLALIACFVLLGCSQSSAPSSTNSAPITEGKDYLVIPTPLGPTHLAGSKIKVYEFFSYGCPWCYRFDPYLEKWLTTQPNDVDFERVPVVFETGWDTLAKAYYTARDLGVENKMTPLIFAGQQTQNIDLTDPTKLRQFFVQNGVSGDDFDSTFNFTPGIAAQMMHGDQLMRQFSIYEIPTIVVDGKYISSVRMTNGDNTRFIQVMDFLINKERTEAN